MQNFADINLTFPGRSASALKIQISQGGTAANHLLLNEPDCTKRVECFLIQVLKT